MPAGYIVYATTDNEAHAAAIARRLIEEEGRDATTADCADLPDVRSAFRYAVLAAPICDEPGRFPIVFGNDLSLRQEGR